MNIAEQIKWLEALKESGNYVAEVDDTMVATVIASLRKLDTPRKAEWLWHHGTPPKRGVYRVKCDGPNPNAGYRYWDGSRWHAWCSTHKGALSMYKAGVRSGAYRRPIMYATKAK